MVCAWDTDYPLGGISNIKGVFSTLESAEKYIEELNDVPDDESWHLKDYYYEIFSSDELPWMGK